MSTNDNTYTKAPLYKVGDVLRLDPHFFNETNPDERMEITSINLVVADYLGPIYRYELFNLHTNVTIVDVSESVLSSMMHLDNGYKASIAFDQELFDILEEASLTDLAALEEEDK